MYVWERLHVQGRRIPGRARRKRKFTDWYFLFFFLKKKRKFLYCKFEDFWTLWWKAPFWLVQNQKKKEMEI
jgi:hypothetical protein